MVCSEGSRAVSARSTVRPPTPLSKTPMGASIGLQDACTGYLEKGIFQEAEAWLGTANRTCEWKAPAIASIPHRPAATLGTSSVPVQSLAVCAACTTPDGSVNVYVIGQAAPPAALKSHVSVAEPRPLPTGSASTSMSVMRPGSKRPEAGRVVWYTSLGPAGVLRIPLIAKLCVPVGIGATCSPSTPLVLQATSPAAVPPVPSGFGSSMMRTVSTCASAQVIAPCAPGANPPALVSASQLTSAVATGCTSTCSSVSPRTVNVCELSKRVKPLVSNAVSVTWYVPSRNGPRSAPMLRLPSLGSMQKNWSGVSTSLATSTWTMCTPACWQVWPAKVQKTCTSPRLGSPHPEERATRAARPAIAVSGARMSFHHPPARQTCVRAFRIQTKGPAAIHPGHGNRTRGPHVWSASVRF